MIKPNDGQAPKKKRKPSQPKPKAAAKQNRKPHGKANSKQNGKPNGKIKATQKPPTQQEVKDKNPAPIAQSSAGGGGNSGLLAEPHHYRADLQLIEFAMRQQCLTDVKTLHATLNQLLMLSLQVRNNPDLSIDQKTRILFRCSRAQMQARALDQQMYLKQIPDKVELHETRSVTAIGQRSILVDAIALEHARRAKRRASEQAGSQNGNGKPA